MSASEFSKSENTSSPTDATSARCDHVDVQHEPYGDDFTIIAPRKTERKTLLLDDDEPLVDTTAALTLHSKKTERLQKKAVRRSKKSHRTDEPKTLLDLPSELFEQILTWLKPSAVFSLARVNKSTQAFVQHHESSISRSIIQARYSTLSRCFNIPVPLSQIDLRAQEALLGELGQKRIEVHRIPYQHIPRADPTHICSCISCVLGWNNLCVVLDLAHFQPHLSNREPIPMIARGTQPDWNLALLAEHARIVETAMRSPLAYAAILEKHLATTISTLTRRVRVGKKTVHPKRLFHISEADVRAETDAFLENEGPPSYEFPFNRDIYYSVEAYVPNRKWSEAAQRWMYAEPGKPHEMDVAWVVERHAQALRTNSNCTTKPISSRLRRADPRSEPC